MELHERHVPVETARRELARFVAELAEKHELTLAEGLTLLAEELARRLGLQVEAERRRKVEE